jgi:hypothetical protein
MSDSPAANEDPAVVGVPPETPEQVRPSATGLVAGPVEGDTDVVVADSRDQQRRSPDRASREPAGGLDQTLQDAEGGIEGSLLDAPDDQDGGGSQPM